MHSGSKHLFGVGLVHAGACRCLPVPAGSCFGKRNSLSFLAAGKGVLEERRACGGGWAEGRRRTDGLEVQCQGEMGCGMPGRMGSQIKGAAWDGAESVRQMEWVKQDVECQLERKMERP